MKRIKVDDLLLLIAAIAALKSDIYNDSNAARRDLDDQFESIDEHFENLKKLIGEESDQEIELDLFQSPRQLETIIRISLQGIFERVVETEVRGRKNRDEYPYKVDQLSPSECLEAKENLNAIRNQISNVYANLRSEKHRFSLSVHY